MKLMKTLATAAVLVGVTMNVGMAEPYRVTDAEPVPPVLTTPVEPPPVKIHPAFVPACPIDSVMANCPKPCVSQYGSNVAAHPLHTLDSRLVTWFKETGIPAADKAVGECKPTDEACNNERNAMLNDNLYCCEALNIVNGEMTQCR